MRRICIYIALIVCSLSLMAQEMPDNLWQADAPAQGGCEYVANEVIVKFKATSPVQIQRHQTTRRFVSASVNVVDRVLDSLGIIAVDDLMPLTGAQVSNQPMRVRGQQLKPDQNLSKLCNIVFDTTKIQTVDEAIIMLERLTEVEYAEPNYIVRIMATTFGNDQNDATTYSHEPLYSHQQHAFKAINLPWLWEQPKSKKRPVIAIIDTGVDIEHPDLKDNIWCNEAEINGWGGYDDDGNGFFDDIHGYDFVNNTGVIGDRNGHGTHCAGIAAAVGKNGIGITGANPDALIMPIQVMDKSGAGNMANIIKGIDYASANGADILSMSIGGNCYSAAEEEALLKAFYKGKYIVAAAGNEGADIYRPDGICIRKHCFPGAFKFVIGVMATDNMGNKASFSNYDEDGPYFSEYDPAGPAFFGDYYNYDIAAPGSNIMSTFLGGAYTTMSGTSMSTPLVAGALSRLLQCRRFYSQESCQGVLIQTRDTNNFHLLDMKAAMQMDELNVNPVLVVSNYHIVDTLDGGNGDGLINPGETIEIYPTVRCVYGVAENATIRINHGLNVDTTTLELVQREAAVGYSLAPGASIQTKEPIIAKVTERCQDGYTIQLYPTIKVDSTSGITTASAYAHRLVLKVEDIVNLNGMIRDSLTLTPDKKYLLTGSFVLDEGAVLNILPGTTIIFKPPFRFDTSYGHVNAKGTPDSLIHFTSSPNIIELTASVDMKFSRNDTLEYVQFSEFNYSGDYIPLNISNVAFKNCIFKDNRLQYDPGLELTDIDIIQCNIMSTDFIGFTGGVISYATNIINNKITASKAPWSITPWWEGVNSINACNVFGNFTHDGTPTTGTFYSDETAKQEYVRLTLDEPAYFGTYDPIIIGEALWDVHDDALRELGCLGEFVIDNRLSEPSRLAHGIVWKVLINDEEIEPYKTISTPLGVGTHKIDIYYSRPMDINVHPAVSFGIRPPYTQNLLPEGSWSSDSTIYTTYYTIDARSMTDGTNFMLIEGGRDYDSFPVPTDKARFQFIIQATGSLATGLYAEPGIGSVMLKWHTDEEDFEDLMGYNLYRWTEVEDSIYIEYDENWNWIGEWQYFTRMDTVVINDYMLTKNDVEFLDTNVVAGKPYYYQIMQVTTSFANYNLSNPVAAIPLTATKGDANGSLAVDVADIVTEIAYISGHNPQPFIFEAADVNADKVINILDVVATINIITNPSASSLGFSDTNTATYSIENGILYIETPVVLGGVQFAFDADAEISALEALNGFERMTWNTAETFNFMAYSMSGKALTVGKHALLYVGDAEMKQIVLSNAQGQNVPAIKKTATDLSSVEAMQMQVAHPNPFTSHIDIPYIVGQTGTHEVRLVFTNIAGMVVDSYATTNTFGEYTYTWHPANLPEGVYFVTLYVDNKKMQSCKLIRVK